MPQISLAPATGWAAGKTKQSRPLRIYIRYAPFSAIKTPENDFDLLGNGVDIRGESSVITHTLTHTHTHTHTHTCTHTHTHAHTHTHTHAHTLTHTHTHSHTHTHTHTHCLIPSAHTLYAQTTSHVSLLFKTASGTNGTNDRYTKHTAFVSHKHKNRSNITNTSCKTQRSCTLDKSHASLVYIVYVCICV